jgi:hypothetical protein
MESMTPTKEQIREQYLANQLFLIGEKVGTLEVIDRRANYIVVVNGAGDTSKLFLDEAHAIITEQAEGHVHPHSLNPNCHCVACKPLERPCACKSCARIENARKALDNAGHDDESEEYQNAEAGLRAAYMGLGESTKTPIRFSKFSTKLDEGFSYKGYKPRNFHNCPEAGQLFESLTKTATDPYAVLSAIKHVDIFFEKRDEHSLEIARTAVAKIDDVAKHTYLTEGETIDKDVFPLDLPVTEDTIKDEEIDFKIEEKLTYSTMAQFLSESFEQHVHHVMDHLEKHPQELDKLADHVKTIEHIAHHYDNHSVHMSESAETKAIAHAEPAQRIHVRTLSSGPQLVKIAKRAAVELIAQKLANKPVKKISAKEKTEIVKAIKQRKTVVMKLARKLVPKIRHIEHESHEQEFGSGEG